MKLSRCVLKRTFLLAGRSSVHKGSFSSFLLLFRLCFLLPDIGSRGNFCSLGCEFGLLLQPLRFFLA